MAQLLTPPASRHSSESPDAELKQLQIADPAPDLLESLDTLLEKYLVLLDQHQKLQQALASKLSSGFFSLAQANYTCPPGRRYGADYYDDRMKATRRVALQPVLSLDESNSMTEQPTSQENGLPSKHIFVIEPATTIDEDEQPETRDRVKLSQSDEKGVEQELQVKEEGSDSIESTATSQDSASTRNAEPEADGEPKPAGSKPRASDPIRWYGILVPPSLRSAQKSFTEAVESNLPGLASVVVEMQAAEKEITRLRTELGRG